VCAFFVWVDHVCARVQGRFSSGEGMCKGETWLTYHMKDGDKSACAHAYACMSERDGGREAVGEE